MSDSPLKLEIPAGFSDPLRLALSELASLAEKVANDSRQNMEYVYYEAVVVPEESAIEIAKYGRAGSCGPDCVAAQLTFLEDRGVMCRVRPRAKDELSSEDYSSFVRAMETSGFQVVIEREAD